MAEKSSDGTPPVLLPDGEFKNYPTTVGELRSDRSENARDWSPRDALVNMLREIDSGKVVPDAFVVIVRTTDEDGGTKTFFRNSAPDVHVTLGMMRVVEWQMLGLK